MARQRISYVPLEKMDAAMRAEMERCAREGTPRPESTAVRAHVPACFWFFANSWNDIFRMYRHFSEPELVKLGCAVGLTLDQQSWLRLLNIEHHQVLAGTAASMAPGFETAEALATTSASADYWAKQDVAPTEGKA